MIKVTTPNGDMMFSVESIKQIYASGSGSTIVLKGNNQSYSVTETPTQIQAQSARNLFLKVTDLNGIVFLLFTYRILKIIPRGTGSAITFNDERVQMNVQESLSALQSQFDGDVDITNGSATTVSGTSINWTGALTAAAAITGGNAFPVSLTGLTGFYASAETNNATLEAIAGDVAIAAAAGTVSINGDTIDIQATTLANITAPTVTVTAEDLTLEAGTAFYLRTPAVVAATATAGQVPVLVNATTGETEFATFSGGNTNWRGVLGAPPGSPVAGDWYTDLTTQEPVYWDNVRSKWLGRPIKFDCNRNGNVLAGASMQIGTSSMTNFGSALPPYGFQMPANMTIVGFYTRRNDPVAASVDYRIFKNNNTGLHSVTVGVGIYNSSQENLDIDVASTDILGVQVQTNSAASPNCYLIVKRKFV